MVIHPHREQRVTQTSNQGEALFHRAKEAGIDLDQIKGLVSDGSRGLSSYLCSHLCGVSHQRCVFPFWRDLAALFRPLLHAWKEAGEEHGHTLLAALHLLLDEAQDWEAVKAAREPMEYLPQTAALVKSLRDHWDDLLVWRYPFHHGLSRNGPEWLWRDFRLRLSHGRNHPTSDARERAGVRWPFYRNLTPHQNRKEKKRRHKHPGLSPFEAAGITLHGVSYLDVLQV